MQPLRNVKLQWTYTRLIYLLNITLGSLNRKNVHIIGEVELQTYQGQLINGSKSEIYFDQKEDGCQETDHIMMGQKRVFFFFRNHKLFT